MCQIVYFLQKFSLIMVFPPKSHIQLKIMFPHIHYVPMFCTIVQIGSKPLGKVQTKMELRGNTAPIKTDN